MSISNYDTAIRNQSEATTHSRGSSPPADSHNEAHSQRKSKSAAPFRSVGMSSVSALKTLNSGWQVWANPSSDSRNTSASSAATIPESSPSQAEGAYRSGLGAEPWNNARATSGSWDEDLSPPVSLNTTRQRQAGSTQVSSLGSNSLVLPKANQYSPQRYDSTASNTPSRYSAASPTRAPYGSSNSPFSAQQPLVHLNNAPSYDPAQAPSTIDHDLSAAMRGMAVEDEFSANQTYRQPQPSTAGGQPQSSAPQHARGPHPLQQSRGPYSGYPQADYAAYYAGPSRVEYPYPYEPYRHGDSMYASSPALSASSPAPSGYPAVAPQNIHPHSVPDLRGQQFYDYSSPGRPHSQFYYPSQPMMYHAPPSPMIRGPVHSKKRSMQQYNPIHPIPQTVLYPNVVYIHGNMSAPLQAQQNGGRNRRQEEASAAYRSQLLEEFRNDKVRKWELRDILGYVVEFSGDQHGSRFIQQKLETATQEEKQAIFDEIVPENSLQLIQDVFGNYVVQKLFEHGTQMQKTLLANTMEGHILPLSLQMYGCRVVQKAVENVSPEQQSIFVKELDASVLRCVKDANGNHVIQRLIERVSPERLEFVKSFRGNVYDLSTHPYGCRVLQRCFEHLPEEYTRPLLDEVHKCAIHLMQDQFGNYVIQFVLEHGQPQDRALIVSKLRGQMFNMSRHKFASNVCEKALVMADSESRRLLIDEMMAPKHDGVSPVLSMMKDQFANYVLQRALSVVEGEQKDALIDRVKPHLVTMRRYSSHSRHLIAIERLLEKCTSTPSNGEQGQSENVATMDASTSH